MSPLGDAQITVGKRNDGIISVVIEGRGWPITIHMAPETAEWLAERLLYETEKRPTSASPPGKP